MKKLLVIVLLFISAIAYCGNLNFKNDFISIDLDQNDTNLILSQITHVETGQKFLKNPDKPLWSFKIKKAGDITGDAIVLTPNDAEEFSFAKKSNNIILSWKNVKNDQISKGFNVTVKLNFKLENSYWNLSIENPNQDWGIWSVTFPYISQMETNQGDEYALPIRGGVVLRDFNEKGFLHPYFEDDKWTDVLEYSEPHFMQFESLTKGKSTLYLSAEDPHSNHKKIIHKMTTPGTMDYSSEEYPLFMAKGGENFTENYSFNIAIIKGDWVDSCKKYRKWGVANQYGPFANGRFDTRQDIPDWWKKCVACMYYYGKESQNVDSLGKTMDFLQVPMVIHVNEYKQSLPDTQYPNILPLNQNWNEEREALEKMGYKIMVYTNAHLVDENLSPSYKEYGDQLVSLDAKGEPYYEPWAKDKGAYDVVCCPDSIYSEVYQKEAEAIMKEAPYDSLYMDQVGAIEPALCFNPAHKNHFGGGDHWVKAYNESIKNMRKSLGELRGEPVVFVTEDMGDAIAYDGWLRVNDNISRNFDTPMNVMVYSGYALNFGDSYFPEEYKDNDNQGIINKVSVDFAKGIMPGYNIGYNYDFEKNPNYAKHFKNMAKAREKGYEYFNLGEMVRGVKITSPIPTKDLYFKHYTNAGVKPHKLVRTCSFYYKGKTCIAFISSSFEPIQVDFEATWQDLYLEPQTISLSEIYPAEKKVENKGKEPNVKYSFTIEPLETVMFIAEN